MRDGKIFRYNDGEMNTSYIRVFICTLDDDETRCMEIITTLTRRCIAIGRGLDEEEGNKEIEIGRNRQRDGKRTEKRR